MPKAVPGEYIIGLKKNSLEWNRRELSEELDAKVKYLTANRRFIVAKKAGPWREVLQEWRQNDLIEFVEPNLIYHIVKTPNDPQFDKLWGMSNPNGFDIGAVKAWDITTGSKKVVVAVIDTGIDPRIADLKDNMWINEKELNGKKGVDDDGNGCIDDIYGCDFFNNDGDPLDDHGHGSHVSGTIAASGDNGTDVVGVNWEVRLMAVKFLSSQGFGSLAGAVQAIDYATRMGAQIMSNSWGGGGFSQALEKVIETAYKKNILFVAAAGNSGSNNDSQPTYPSSYEVPNVISVAAINSKGDLSSFSCYGPKSVDIAAPGEQVLSTTPNGLKSWSGTSMATPHVSGVAALVWSHEPDLGVEQIKARLLKTARPLASLKGKILTEGLVNAFNALTNKVEFFTPRR